MAGAFNNGVIHLDTSSVFVFYSGQIVAGSIMFELDQPLTFSVIYIQVVGEANVAWTESEVETVNSVKNHKIIKYEGREEYFNYTYNLAGGESGISRLSTGRQNIPFKFQIPFTAPSSYKGELGQVSYSMTAHLVIPEQIHAHELISRNFEVVAPLNLNLGSPRIKEPIDLEFEEVYGCCCSSDPVTVRVRLPISGYCPGQVIPVAIEVDNVSNVEITKMIFEIFSKELYRSQRPQSEYIVPENVLVTTKKGPVMGNTKRNFTVDLAVPEILPPNLENCSIIDVGYFFRITIKLSGCNDDMQEEAELCLGLIPVQEFTEGEYVHPLAHSLPTGPIPDPNTTTELLLPPVTAGFRGSNACLQRAQHSPVQAAQYHTKPPQTSPYTDSPPPYPYPTENKFETPVSIEMKPRPYEDYGIGFKVPESSPTDKTPGYPTSGPGYPTSGPGYPTSGPGYPTSGPGYPTRGPGYPTSGPGYPTSGPGYPKSVPGYPTSGPGYPTSGPGIPTSGPGYPTKGPGYPTGGPGYPTNAPSGMNPPPYGGAQPPYPAGSQIPGSNNVGPPCTQGGYQPSAPPPN